MDDSIKILKPPNKTTKSLGELPSDFFLIYHLLFK